MVYFPLLITLSHFLLMSFPLMLFSQAKFTVSSIPVALAIVLLPFVLLSLCVLWPYYCATLNLFFWQPLTGKTWSYWDDQPWAKCLNSHYWQLVPGFLWYKWGAVQYSKQSPMLNDSVLSCRDQGSDLLQGSPLLRVLLKVLNYGLEDNMLNSAHRCRVQAARELLY